MQQRDYKYITESDWTKFSWADYKPIMFNVINSAIVQPANGSVVSIGKDNEVPLSGYASGDGETGVPIEKVQLSFDNEKTWVDA